MGELAPRQRRFLEAKPCLKKVPVAPCVPEKVAGPKVYGKCIAPNAIQIENEQPNTEKIVQNDTTTRREVEKKLPNVTTPTADPYSLFDSPTKCEQEQQPFLTLNIDQNLASILSAGWMFGFNRTDNSIVNFQCTGEFDLQIEVSVETNTGLFTLGIQGQNIPNETIDRLPLFLTSADDLINLLQLIKRQKMCLGINHPLAKASRSSACTFIISQKEMRCDSCRKELKNVYSAERRKELPKSRLRICNMSPSKVKQVAREEKQKRILLERKLKRLKARLAKESEKGPDSADSELLQEFLAVDANNPCLSLMIKQQLKAAMVSRSGMRWHPEILKWAARLRTKCASAYQEINRSKFLKLPSTKTLRRMFGHFPHNPGFDEQVLDDVCNNVDGS